MLLTDGIFKWPAKYSPYNHPPPSFPWLERTSPGSAVRLDAMSSASRQHASSSKALPGRWIISLGRYATKAQRIVRQSAVAPLNALGDADDLALRSVPQARPSDPVRAEICSVGTGRRARMLGLPEHPDGRQPRRFRLPAQPSFRAVSSTCHIRAPRGYYPFHYPNLSVIISAFALRRLGTGTAAGAHHDALLLLLTKGVAQHVTADTGTNLLQLADFEGVARPGPEPVDAVDHHMARSGRGSARAAGRWQMADGRWHGCRPGDLPHAYRSESERRGSPTPPLHPGPPGGGGRGVTPI
jgi:hypothetical protein